MERESLVIDGLVTIGCLMAEVDAHESEKITTSSGGEVKLTFCLTTESEHNTLIVTGQMRMLSESGFVPIAIARADPKDFVRFHIFAVEGLCQELTSALEVRGAELVRNVSDKFQTTHAQSRAE